LAQSEKGGGKAMKILLAVLIALSTASSVYAQHPIWLDEAIRVDNPYELVYWTAVEFGCPLTEQEVDSVVEDVLMRNRIKPIKPVTLEDGRIYLNVSLRCTNAGADGKHAFSININYGRYKPWPAILFDVPYAAVGLGDKDLIRRDCQARLVDAVAAFKKANMHFFGKR
jgi:hypothetical protein